MPATSTTGGGGALSSTPIQGDATPYLVASARAHGADPAAVLAVAHGEGGTTSPGPIGDNGTSFGPFQMHIGGALPSALWSSPTRAQAWAWSPAGIDYAVQRIAAVTQGLSGPAAIAAAVQRFERPAAPGPEIQRDTAYYNSQAAGRVAGGGVGGQVGGQVAAAGAGGSNPGGKLFQCQTTSGGISLPLVGQVTPNFIPDVGCYLRDTLLFLVYAFGGLGAVTAGLMLVWPRAGRTIVKAAGAVTPVGRVAEAGAAGAGIAERQAAAESRRGELHAERVKQARARTSQARARARVERSRATQERLATGSPTRLSAVEEARIKRAQARVGQPRPDRMAG